MPRSLLVAVLISSCAGLTSVAPDVTHARDSAPSSHLVFDDNFDGDIIINEVRVPKDGEALHTYYEALGWRGKGAGYAGIQAHPKAHLFIFSIWDHKAHRAPIRAVHRGPGTKTVGFGGEGTGLKSWNFDLGWSTGVWYTLVARTWPMGDHTYYGFWSRAGDTGKWTHLVTMDVAVETTFKGGTDAFIEDWLSTGKKARTTHLRGGWKRKLDGSWYAFKKARYSVNSWDLDPGKRSYNFRTSWDGGIASDTGGQFWFMTSGGEKTKPSTKNPSSVSIARKKTAPDFARIEIESLNAKRFGDTSLEVSWKPKEATAPQFAWELRISATKAEGASGPVVTIVATNKVPHERSATVDIRSLGVAPEDCAIELVLRDIFDRKSKSRRVNTTR